MQKMIFFKKGDKLNYRVGSSELALSILLICRASISFVCVWSFQCAFLGSDKKFGSYIQSKHSLDHYIYSLNYMLSTLAVIYLITICLAVNKQPSVIGPLSPVTSQKLFTLQNTSPNSELMISPKLESLQLDQMTSQVTPQTEIKMSVFNRSVPGNLNTYNLTQPGVWSFVLSSARSLSCSLLINQGIANNTQNQALGFLSFNRELGQLNLEAETAFAQITQNITLAIDQIRRTVRLGEKCSNGGLLLRNNFEVLRASQNWTALRLVAVPAGWQPQAVSDDLIYIISQSKLYKFNDLMNGYEQIYSLPQSSSYFIRNYQNRIIVTLNQIAAQSAGNQTEPTNNTVPSNASNININNTNSSIPGRNSFGNNQTNNTNNNATSNISDQVLQITGFNLTVLVFNNEANMTNITLIGQFQSAMRTQQEKIKVLISPLLTKVAVVTSSNPSTFNLVAKHIDYSQNQILDIKFEQPNRFLQTLNTSNLQTELDFGDYYIVVRNGSSYQQNVQSRGNLFQNNTFTINNTILPSNTTNNNKASNPNQAELFPTISGGTSSFHPNCLILPTNILIQSADNKTCVSYPPVRGSVRSLPVEEVYQFVGTNVVLVQTRNLQYSVANRELTSFIKTFIDTSLDDRAIVINQYQISNSTFDFDEFDYGNYLSNGRVQAISGNTRRMVKPVTPIFSFAEPTYNHVYSTEHLLQWIYTMGQNNTNMTNLSVFTFDNTTVYRYRENNFTMDPFFNVLYQSERYLLLQSTDAIKLFTYNTLQKRYVESADLTSLFNNKNLQLPQNILYLNATDSNLAVNFSDIKNMTNTSQSNNSTNNAVNTTNLNASASLINTNTANPWLVSSDGNRIAAGNRLFVRETGNNFKQVFINETNVTIASIDSSLSYLLTNLGTLYLFDFQNNRVIPLNSNGITFPTDSIVNASYNRVVVHAYNGNSLWIKAFQIDDGFNLNQCFDYVQTKTVYKSRVYLSPYLTKIIVLKDRNQVSNFDCFNPSNESTPANNTPVVPPSVVPPPVIPPANNTPSNFTPPSNFLPPLNNTPTLPPQNFTPTVIPPKNSSNATRRLTTRQNNVLTQPSGEDNSNNNLILCNITIAQVQQQLQTVVEVYCINYGANSFEKIPIASSALVDPKALFVDLSQNMLFIRQISSTSNQTPNQTVNPLSEYIYYFSQNVVLLPVISRSVVSYPNSVWQRAVLLQRRGKLYLMCEYVQTVSQQTTRFVTSQEFNAVQAQFNYQSPFLKTETVSGLIKICPIGCPDCLCSTCLPGYALDNQKISCRPCPENCQTCRIGYPSVCTLCWPGAYLTPGGSCQVCDQSCVTCNISATQCTSCPPGHYFNPLQQTCTACPLNCFRCSDNTTCEVCRQGFVLGLTNQTALCIGCALTCTNCNPSNITECTACALGLQLVQGRCVRCPQNCLKCNGNKCGLCSQGYSFNKYGSCILKCQLPCITCVDNQPTVCLSCQYGSTLVGGTCQLQLNWANLTSQGYLDTCGVGLNYYLYLNSNNVSSCEECPKINNCIQCDYFNTYRCAICSPGYYVDSYGYCSACLENCSTCVSDGICLSCKPGFTILANYKEGVCLQCEWPCAACVGTTTYCTSCQSGYVMKQWRCINIDSVSLTFTLGSNTNNSSILSQINQITQGLVYLLNQNNTNITDQDIIVTEVMGDKVVIYYVPPNKQNLPLNLTNALLNTTIPGTYFNITDFVASTNTTARRLAEQTPLLLPVQASQGAVMTVNVTIIIVLLLVALAIFKLRIKMYAKRLRSFVPVVASGEQKSVLDETVQKQISSLLPQ